VEREVAVRLHLRKLDYKWVVLSNTTLGTLLAMINSSILLIALPDIFRGIGIDPLQPGNTSYLLWLLLGFLVVLAVLLVSLGRLGDMYGRVRMFNLGFAVFTFFSILLSITWLHGGAGALWLILMRVGQGVGGALVFANSSAILTDAFPHDERGLALGINSVSMAVCSRRSSGGSSSSSRCRSGSPRRSGRTTRCATSACARRAGSTGGAT
jgi:MFS family permease